MCTMNQTFSSTTLRYKRALLYTFNGYASPCLGELSPFRWEQC